MDATETLYRHYLENRQVSTDSRNIPHGCIFFSLRGDNFDGNRFAAEALEKGAAMAVVDDPSLPRHPSFIFVPDCLAALQQLAMRYRKDLQTRILAITGSNGKTTTKELVARVLSSAFSTYATAGNLNNHIGVPLSLLSIPPGTEFAVIEMGANHQGEIAQLCEIARPGFGLITNIGKAHLEGFGDFQGVVTAKTELYRFIRQNNGLLFVNKDNPLLLKHAEGCRQFTYGSMNGTDCQGKILGQDPFLKVEWLQQGTWNTADTQLYGEYNFENILAALAAGMHFGIDAQKIREAVESYRPVNNRSQVVNTKQNRLILDAYNANPTSVEAALRNFASLPGEDKCVILGDMLELGDGTLREHQLVIDLLQELGFQHVLLTGEIFSALVIPAQWNKFADADQLRSWLLQNQPSGQTILIKGSRKIMLEKIVEAL